MRKISVLLTLTIALCLGSIFILLPNQIALADGTNTHYWVGGSGNWSDTAHWSHTQGGVGGEAVPGVGNSVVINNIGATVTMDVVASCKNLTLTNGILNTNGHPLSVGLGTSGDFISLSGVQTLTLGASVVTCYGDFDATEIDTINAGASTLNCYGEYFKGGGKTYNDVLLKPSQIIIHVTGVNTFDDLTLNNFVSEFDTIYFDDSQTITGTFTAAGDSDVVRLAVFGSGLVTMTAAVVLSTHTDYAYIDGAGPGDWDLSSAPEDSIDYGHNVGLTCTFPYDEYRDYYWVGGAGTWDEFTVGQLVTSGYSWSDTSGGIGGAKRLLAPKSCNDVYFDVNSGILLGDNTIIVTGDATCRDINFTGCPTTPNIIGDTITYYGDLTIYLGMDTSRLIAASPSTSEATIGDGESILDTSPAEPSHLYTEGNTDGLMGLGDLIDPALAVADIPVALFWYPIAFTIAIVAGFVCYGFTKALLVQAFVSGVVMAMFCGGGALGDGLLPYWTVLLFGGEAGAILILQERQIA